MVRHQLGSDDISIRGWQLKFMARQITAGFVERTLLRTIHLELFPRTFTNPPVTPKTEFESFKCESTLFIKTYIEN